ncbi:hypothetical protein SPBR_06432 [Sporothrix brasiliensis 5110]|uniref:Uncharacterized protein n=1 Tax=Sporothrix brasiliensis 5110 TaxID=1398154 RepID=A0A0C2FB12_9PEZI|nr:uncharacterized protein SPBR_06432 [Sporothrix brasiliensis 5110]KIH88253.1 hypothetical protein SPBR_06432 [Sporothrix brasiliensis 5110]
MPSNLLLSVGFRAEFLIGFTETDHDNNNDNLACITNRPNNGGPPAVPLPPPDPASQPIRLPVRNSPESHDRVLFGAVVHAMGNSIAVSQFIEETDPIYPLLATDAMRSPPLYAKSQFWFAHKWFVASAASHFVGPLVPVMLPRPPRRGGGPQAPSPLLAFSWRPVAITTPVFTVSDVLPDMFLLPDPQQDQHAFANHVFEAQRRSNALVSAPLQGLRSLVLTQLNDSCSFVVHVGLTCSDEENEPRRLLALKKLVTILWLGGEAFLAKLAGPKAVAVTPLLTESASLRVRPSGFAGHLLNVLDDNQGSNSAYDKWLSPLLGPAPVLADVHKQVTQRNLADYVLRRETPNVGTRPGRRRFGVNTDLTVSHELFLLWRARDVDTIAKLMTPYFWKGPSQVPPQHCAIDFANLRNDVREEHRSTHHATIAFRLFPATLDPAMVLAWTRLSAGLAAQAAFTSPAQFLKICNRLTGGPKGDSNGSHSPDSSNDGNEGSVSSSSGGPGSSSYGGSSGNDGDKESSGNSSDSDGADTVRGAQRSNVAPELLIPFRQASTAAPPVDNWVAPPGLALPIARPPVRFIPGYAIEAPADNRFDRPAPVLPIVQPLARVLARPNRPRVRLSAGFTDTEGEDGGNLQNHNTQLAATIYALDNYDSQASGWTSGWSSNSMPYTSAEGEEVPDSTGAQPMNLTSDESEPSSSFQNLNGNEPATNNPGSQGRNYFSVVLASDNHASDTDGWTSDSPPYTTDEEENISAPAGFQPMDPTSGESESSSSQDAHRSEVSPPQNPGLQAALSPDYPGTSTEGWTSDSPPYTTTDEEDASDSSGALPMDLTSDESEPSSSFHVFSSDHHGPSTDNTPYMTTEEEDASDSSGALPMDLTSDESESPSSSQGGNDNVPDMVESENHGSNTDGWTSDSPPYTSVGDTSAGDTSAEEEEPFTPTQLMDLSSYDIEPSSVLPNDPNHAIDESDRYHTDTEGWTNDSPPYTSVGETSAEEEEPFTPTQLMDLSSYDTEPSSVLPNDPNHVIDESDRYHTDTEGWTSDSPPYTSEEEHSCPSVVHDANLDAVMSGESDNQSVVPESASNHAVPSDNDPNDTPPQPAHAAGIPAASFVQNSQSDASREGSPLDDHVRDNSNDLDADPFDVWAFVRWLNIGQEPLETLRQFVDVHNNVHPEDQPQADGGLPTFPR